MAHFNATAAEYETSTGGCTRELARLLLDLPQLERLCRPESILLDNACGTGIVSEEVVLRAQRKKKCLPSLYPVDFALEMVYTCMQKLLDLDLELRYEDLDLLWNFHTGLMPGEMLLFPDEMFTHSITNLGILFFYDSVAGARQIYRTLKPGGVAVVTSWSALGYVENVIHPAQAIVRPDDPPYKVPISEVWFDAGHVEECLREGGFQQVSLSSRTVHYGAASVPELVDLLLNSFRMLWKNWPEEDQKKFRDVARERIEAVSRSYIMNDGNVGVSIPMSAIVAVCEK
ncbi:methyltransferase type 11 [Fusarium albosuccineum]|uniref:Methyltransferase type 11 n=1 Tax=Fusarium albosuccineum TaxID=1237068 RepID=A0A8H4PB37_9HYPO|nr:methyltransferase type 11 [Fusarium albosuccineum]